MSLDSDIKIAGDKPSKDVERNRRQSDAEAYLNDEELERAKQLGRIVAERFTKDAEEAEQNDENGNSEMMLQRRLLLSFTATVGFEQYCRDDMLAGVAQKSFLDTLRQADADLYRSSSDTGAFSFYYLAYRRGSEIDRRVGQTFAMLCLHDGDPIFQELGEALYCWFSSVIKRSAKQLNLL